MTAQRLVVRPVRGLSDAARELADWWSAPLNDPFAQDLLVTPGPGHHRWFSQQLALRYGITAGVRPSTLTRLERDLQHQLLGIDPRHDPWSPTALQGVVLDLIDENLDEPWLHRVRDHLFPLARSGSHPANQPEQQPPQSGQQRPGRRITTAGRIVDLWLSYLDRAPQLLADWNAGRALDIDGSPLDETWQYELWVRAVARITTQDPLTRREALLSALSSAARDDQRTAVICLDPVTSHQRRLLAELGRQRPTTVWPLIAIDCHNPVTLARWGSGQQRLWQRVTEWQADADVEPITPPPRQGHPATALERLQLLLSGSAVDPGPPNDGTVQVHSSHGLDRQVEVVREVLTGLFESDPSLEPRDVVLCCTDPGAASSLLDAAFGLGEAGQHPGHRLRVQTSGLRPGTNPVLESLSRILALPASRATATDLVDLCAEGPIRVRFGFSDDDIVTITSLLSRADVRWGIDQKHRSDAFDLPLKHGTWFAGIERLLLSAAMSEGTPVLVDQTVTVPHLNSTDVRVVGALAELLSRLRKLHSDLSTPAAAPVWLNRLETLIEWLFDVPRDQGWQLSAARSTLRQWASHAGTTAPLTRADLRVVVDSLIRQSRTRPAFGNGTVQVVDLNSLRGVPHRVVVVLGLDERSFPAHAPRRGDDLSAAVELASDGIDPRERSQSSLLDAVMAAQDHLVVTYAGRDRSTNDLLDEPVVITELVQALNQTCTDSWQVQRHTLQPHSVENFRSDSGVPFSFDRQAEAGAAALSIRLDSPRQEDPDPCDWRFEPVDPTEPVNLDELIAFWRHPGRALLSRVIGTSLRRFGNPLVTDLPLELFGLGELQVAAGVLDTIVAGHDPDYALAVERARGVIPVPPLDSRPIGRIKGSVRRLTAHSRTDQPVTDVAVDLQLGQTSLRGVVRLHGDLVHTTSYANLSGGDLLAHWLRLLALRVGGRQGPLLAHLNRKDGQTCLAAPPAPQAKALLEWFLRWRNIGLSQPLVAPIGMQLKDCQTDGTWADTGKTSALQRSWTWQRDADWRLFTPASWAHTKARSSGIEDLTVVALGQHIFGRIADHRFDASELPPRDGVGDRSPASGPVRSPQPGLGGDR